MENLKVLALGRNQIKKIENLDSVAESLEELWISYNVLERLVCCSIKTTAISLLTSNKMCIIIPPSCYSHAVVAVPPQQHHLITDSVFHCILQQLTSLSGPDLVQLADWCRKAGIATSLPVVQQQDQCLE